MGKRKKSQYGGTMEDQVYGYVLEHPEGRKWLVSKGDENGEPVHPRVGHDVTEKLTEADCLADFASALDYCPNGFRVVGLVSENLVAQNEELVHQQRRELAKMKKNIQLFLEQIADPDLDEDYGLLKDLVQERTSRYAPR